MWPVNRYRGITEKGDFAGMDIIVILFNFKQPVTKRTNKIY